MSTPIIVNKEEVLGHLISLSSFSVDGDDDICPFIMRILANHLEVSLCDLFQMSLESCTVANDWRLATIHKVDRSNPNNYR
ncbi:hypothetical protein GJ496_005402 [Pomphorhynchus laevis]|nr:hypothetical protein GJ496_005402 [Pomphorhynchus laevis]